MYSLSTRLNSVFFFGVMCLVVLSVFNIGTTIFNRKDPIVNKFQVTKFPYFYNNPHTRTEHATGVMDFEFDMTPVFNWNTNLVFVWITATYNTGRKNQTTSVTIYDKIMRRANNARVLVKKDQKFEYPLIDVYRTLPNKDVHYELHWEHMPVVGPILKNKIDLIDSKLPSKQTSMPNKQVIIKEIDYDN